MPKPDCIDITRTLLAYHIDFDSLWDEISDTEQGRHTIDHAVAIFNDAIGKISKVDLGSEHYSHIIGGLETTRNLINEGELQNAREKFDTVINIDLTNAFVDLISECECGEPEEIQLKIPVMISKTVEDALKNAGYDVGTDAYYADPDKYVSVIVRATKDLELRRGG